MNNRSNSISGSAGRTLRYACLSGAAFFFLFPMVFMFVSSLKTDSLQLISDMASLKGFIPYGSIGLDNYRAVFEHLAFPVFFRNSVLVLALTVVAGLFVNSMLAFSLAWIRFPGSRILLSVVIALMIVPMESVVIPLLLMVNGFGLLDTLTVQILPFIADAFSIFLFYQFFRGVPKELLEAGRMDGAGYRVMYARLILPMSRPVLATVAILHSIRSWGEFLWPLMVTRGERARPLPVAIQQLFTLDPKPWGEVFAFSSLITLPVLVLFLLFQSAFVRSVASSGLKG